MAKNTGARGFWWKKFKEEPCRPETLELPVGFQPETEEEEEVENLPQPGEEPELEPEKPAPVQETLADVAARLAAEEEEKRTYEQAAAEEAKRAEAAFRLSLIHIFVLGFVRQ